VSGFRFQGSAIFEKASVLLLFFLNTEHRTLKPLFPFAHAPCYSSLLTSLGSLLVGRALHGPTVALQHMRIDLRRTHIFVSEYKIEIFDAQPQHSITLSPPPYSSFPISQ